MSHSKVVEVLLLYKVVSSLVSLVTVCSSGGKLLKILSILLTRF